MWSFKYNAIHLKRFTLNQTPNIAFLRGSGLKRLMSAAILSFPETRITSEVFQIKETKSNCVQNIFF